MCILRPLWVHVFIHKANLLSHNYPVSNNKCSDYVLDCCGTRIQPPAQEAICGTRFVGTVLCIGCTVGRFKTVSESMYTISSIHHGLLLYFNVKFYTTL